MSQREAGQDAWNSVPGMGNSICEGSKQGENPGSAEYLRVGGAVEEGGGEVREGQKAGLTIARVDGRVLEAEPREPGSSLRRSPKHARKKGLEGTGRGRETSGEAAPRVWARDSGVQSGGSRRQWREQKAVEGAEGSGRMLWGTGQMRTPDPVPPGQWVHLPISIVGQPYCPLLPTHRAPWESRGARSRPRPWQGSFSGVLAVGWEPQSPELESQLPKHPAGWLWVVAMLGAPCALL